MRHPRLVVVALLALFAAAPLFAYTVVMRDGSRLVARDKYRVVGDKAIITLQNGTQTSIALSEIDVQRTENANRANLGTAVLLEEGKPTDYTGAPPPERKPSLADVASNRGAAAARQTPSPRPERTVISAAGHTDLRTIPHAAFPSHDLSGELQQLFRGGGIQEIALFRGTRADRPFVEVTTNSEAAIFRTLEVAATALLQIRERYPRKVEALEILMLTANRERAGQFLMTPDLASELAGKKVEASAFFVRHVQF